MSILQKYINFMPKELSPESNPMLNALLQAWSGSDDEVLTQLNNTKAQLFVKTAEGNFLDRLASNYGVSRPTALGLLDSDFQKLIPNLSLKQKQVTRAFYDTMDVFWGPLFSRANVLSATIEPFNLSTGDSFTLAIDGGANQIVNILPGDVRIQGQATTAEVIRVFSRITNLTLQEVTDVTTGNQALNFRTNTPGPRGSIEFLNGFGIFGIVQNFKNLVIDLPQRTVLYQVNAGEVLIELPAVVPTLRRSLFGSHHFHATSALESAIPPANGIWQGSFLYSRSGASFLPTSKKAVLSDTILKGDVLNEITVADSSNIPLGGGALIFNFGKETQEAPVPYITVPNSNTILINPGYSFQQNHLAGSEINFLAPNQSGPYKPRLNGQDLAIYLTSPANARTLVQGILASLAAAGIVVTFLVLLPKYNYIIDNPFAD